MAFCICISNCMFTVESKSDKQPIRAFSRAFVTVPGGARYVHYTSEYEFYTLLHDLYTSIDAYTL